MRIIYEPRPNCPDGLGCTLVLEHPAPDGGGTSLKINLGRNGRERLIALLQGAEPGVVASPSAPPTRPAPAGRIHHFMRDDS